MTRATGFTASFSLSRVLPLLALSVLVALTAWLACHVLSAQLPVSQWPGVVLAGADATLPQLVVRYGWLPRFVMALAAGASLSLAGVVFQQVLRNRLAEPLTLGVASGASLALTVAAVFAPAFAAGNRFTIALAGAALAMLATMALAWRKGFATVSIVLGGMIVNLYAGALTVLLTIVFERSLAAVFLWGGGSLVQNGWGATVWLLPRALACAVGLALLVRPLTLFSLDDRSATQLGLSLAWARPLALGFAVILSALVVSAVGMLGFVGLGGPALARAAGARRLRDQLLWAPPVGAVLLVLADQAVQCLPGVLGELLPTGAALALFGAPLLLVMLVRVHAAGPRPLPASAPPRRHSLRGAVLGLGASLALAIVVALHFGPTLHGWQWAHGAQWQAVAFWRLPRLVASLGAGVMAALAGTLLQRVTGNPMASPELLGVSGGAMLGMLVAAVAVGVPSTPVLLMGSAAGALVCLLAIIALGRRSGFAPEHMLLAGVALSAFAQSAITLATASGGAYANLLRPLLYGSTYVILPATAVTVAACALAAAAVAWFGSRWLDILPLGGNVADALGVPSLRARWQLFVVAAILTAGATIVVGPTSFVGLMAPHGARMLGFGRARSQMCVAALAGALLMTLADWLGRSLMFPQQLPAGVLAALIGAPYLMWLLRR